MRADPSKGGLKPQAPRPPSMCGAQVLSSCDARIGEVWDGLASNTLLLVATGHGDTAEVQRAEESKWRRSQEEPLDGLPRWTAQEDAALQALVGRVTRGLAFAAVKP
mmetsp:Transcript_21020/g.53882  ORF Transcript_21020/g.53882 Transcript_21020/m.53882 type:complete len:107 (-) Transcript_21020:148-468(-)